MTDDAKEGMATIIPTYVIEMLLLRWTGSAKPLGLKSTQWCQVKTAQLPTLNSCLATA
jgi:hypothetical protein